MKNYNSTLSLASMFTAFWHQAHNFITYSQSSFFKLSWAIKNWPKPAIFIARGPARLSVPSDGDS